MVTTKPLKPEPSTSWTLKMLGTLFAAILGLVAAARWLALRPKSSASESLTTGGDSTEVSAALAEALEPGVPYSVGLTLDENGRLSVRARKL